MTRKDWQCQECGKRLTLKQAERASQGSDGCPKCGGSDIDLAGPPREQRERYAAVDTPCDHSDSSYYAYHDN